MEKIGLLDELYSGMSYNVVIVGHEFTVNESCVCVCVCFKTEAQIKKV